MAYLELSGVRKRFGDHVALHDATLAVERGEMVCLLGPSGCGKTTTLRIIAGFEQPDRGEVRLAGADIAPVPPQKRDIGVVFQSYALFPHLTVAENIGFGLRMRRRTSSAINTAVSEALRLVRLAGVANRLPRELSGGQQQRVALARAIAIEPRLLLLDEPLSNLDAKLRDEMRDEIRRVQRTLGITAVFVTHDQQEALALADRIVVMNEGRMVQTGTPTDIYERPSHPFVASFFGRANMLNGEVVAVEPDHVRFRTASGREVVGTAAGALAPGDAVVGVVKFEQALLARQPASGANALPGVLIGSTYLGTHVEYAVEVDGARLGSTRVAPGEAGRFAASEPVALAFAAADCRVMRRDP